MADFKTQLETILNDALLFQSVESAFFGLILHNADEEKNRKDVFVESFKQYWKLIPGKEQSSVTGFFVNYANEQVTKTRLSYLYDLLKHLVECGVIAARDACENILNSEYLQFDNLHVWNESFEFILHFFTRMDYKSVRAVNSVLLNQVKVKLPETIMESQYPLLDIVKKGINIGLDRNACLMPIYFAANEIYKLYPVDSFHPHWALGEIFTTFVNSFKPLAQMVSITGHARLVPVVGHSGSSNVWNLEPTTLKFPLKGPLPYRKDLIEPQKSLLQYVIAQPYSRDIVCSMLGLKKQQKQRCEALEDLLVDLIIVAMEKTENINDGDESHQLLWQHLSSQLIFFILFQFASFPHMVLALHDKLLKRNLNKGRDHLMWVLLQFISGSIQKSPLSIFSPVMKLFDLLYSEKEPLPVPSKITSESSISLSMACIWVHLSKKAKIENISLQRGPPPALSRQLEYLYQILQQKQHDGAGYEIALLCNAYSTNPESFQPPLHELVGRCYGTGQSTIKLPGPKGCVAAGNTVPLDVKLLDSLTVHAKMSLINGIVTRIIQVAQATKQQQQQIALAPALVETYSRLLVYMEIELLGIKGFISQLLPNVLKSKAWGILHTLLEMFSYRLHHIQPHYRVNLLSHLHSVATVPFTDKSQLHLCIQNTALRLIMGFGNSDVQSQLSTQRINSDPKQILSKDCEELNRVLILTIARAMHITGADSLPFTWCEGLLKEAIKITPHKWSQATLSCFPGILEEFYTQNGIVYDVTGKQLLEKIDKHYRKVKSLSNDEEVITYCTETDQVPEVILCIMWKIMLEQGRITPVCYQILMKLRTKALSNYLNTFADFLVHEFKMFISSGSQGSAQVSKRFLFLNEMIWKYDIVPLDRLILSLCLRPHDEKNSQICFYIIKYLLLQPTEFKVRVKKFVEDNTAQHWNQNDWHDRHIAYHEQFPEKFYYEGILEANKLQVQSPEYLPTYFGNICLRFIPVFDILIHRLLEVPAPQGVNTLEFVLKEFGCLFKFHDRPITYLYNTLHYYENNLRENAAIKKKLVSVIINSQTSNYAEGRACSKEFLSYLNESNDSWVPSNQYFVNLISRFVKTIRNENPSPFPSCDWRFNEFPNPSAHALYVTCVELMALPMPGEEVGKAIINVLRQSNSKANSSIRSDIISWINATALIMTSLPDEYLQVINQKVCEVIQTTLSHITLTSASNAPSFFDFTYNHAMNCESYPDYILALFHATWLHSSVGQFTRLSTFLKVLLKPLVMNEAQLLYVFCLFGPFLQRFQQERTRCLFEVSAEFYYMLEQVCKNTTSLVFVDVISDFLYHIKYMFVGDNLREAVDKTIVHFHEPLQNKLKFMALPKREEKPSVTEVVNLT